MKTTTIKCRKQTGSLSLFLALLLSLSAPAMAKDTDIYKVNAKQNSYILLDNSGSMAWGIYEHNIDYGQMYFYLLSQPGITDPTNLPVVSPTPFPKNKIYLLKGPVRVAINNGIAFTGDAGNPGVNWTFGSVVDTHTLVSDSGDISAAGDGTQRITLNADQDVLLDSKVLPLSQNRKIHDLETLYDGSVIDKGFGGLLNAPGYYFSGYEDNDPTVFDNPAEDQDANTYFFVTGNWLNMQAVYNLEDAGGDPVWDTVDVPLDVISSDWMSLPKNIDYPAGNVKYAASMTNVETSKIVQASALKMQVHFSYYNVGKNDSVKLYDATGTLVQTYGAFTDADGFWSPIITGDTVTIKMSSDKFTTTLGYGYKIDEIRYVDKLSGETGVYRMQSRLDVAKDALLYVLDEFLGKMNWGYANFQYLGTVADGATIESALNPNETDDNNRAAIRQHVIGTEPMYGTPLGEALQDVFEEGYWIKRHELDNLLCRKNYVIVVTDGYPSGDDSWNRITDIPAFSDFDGDGWTEDPSQYNPPPEDYYDDVAHWMYTHSWLDKTEVVDPANSYVNVTTHNIGFGLDQPLLENAASESGGDYITAFNKQQLVAAFYSLALKMSQAVSFTAPVVSVDAVNKIQSGEDLYMGLFLPQDSTYWAGNVKKFKLGDDPATIDKEQFAILDKNGVSATNSNGEFLDNTATFWGDDTDVNDSDNYGAADIKEDGAGEVLLEDVAGFFAAATYWNRPIYTWKDGDGDGDMEMVKVDRDHITKDDLGVADDATRDKLVNFIHGYTYDAVAITGAPLAVRDWILGPIIHSRPVVVDYFDTAVSMLPLVKRLIVVGSNDGMFHVFNDDTGREEFAFIPPDILPKIKDVQATLGLFDTVDGLATLYRRDKNPKYLIFGERRGGASFWNLDVSNIDPLQWTVAWEYTNGEISQSWAEVKVASIPVAVTEAGLKSYKDVAIITGGYDPEEDFFPEPFNDLDSNGTPYDANGNLDNKEWAKTVDSQDVYNDDLYNKYNPEMNERGRGIFVVDIDNPAAVTNVTLDDYSIKQLLPFSVTYGAASVITGATQTRPDMKFSFPASPSVVTGLDKYTYSDGTASVIGLKDNVLMSLYTVDVYAQVFKTRFTFDLINYPAGTTPHWYVKNADWAVNKVFNANPGSSIASGESGVYLPAADVKRVNVLDQGRKAFYPPTISWGGSKGFFEDGNYYFPNVTFDTKDKMASLFFGTGDRENPKYTMIRNRFYAIYDDSSVTATMAPSTDVPVTSATYHEDDLLNLTCDELGKESIINQCYLGTTLPDGTACSLATADTDMKRYLNTLLTDNAIYGATPALEYGASHENDAKGWYIVLADQSSAVCGTHMTYPYTTINDATSIDPDNHAGEQILSQVILYAENLYFTSYQAAISEPCNPQGNGFTYALNYLNGSATFDMDEPVNPDDPEYKDMTDRWNKYIGILGIPSGFTVITSDGEAAAMASIGGAVKGPGRDGDTEIPTPGLGLQLYYWRDSNSQQP